MSTIDPTRPDIAYFWPERGRSLAIAEISLGARKFKVGHVTPTTPLLRVIRPAHAGNLYSLLVCKI